MRNGRDRYLTRDQHHDAALAGWTALQRERRDWCCEKGARSCSIVVGW
jgi:hypothetical protein